MPKYAGLISGQTSGIRDNAVGVKLSLKLLLQPERLNRHLEESLLLG